MQTSKEHHSGQREQQCKVPGAEEGLEWSEGRRAVHRQRLIRARSCGSCGPWQGVGCYSEVKLLAGSEQRPDRLTVTSYF